MKKVSMLRNKNKFTPHPVTSCHPSPQRRGAGGEVIISLLFFLALVLLTGCSMRMAPKNSLPVYNTADFTPEWDLTESSNTHRIPSFSFTDQNGNAFGSKELEGKIYIVDFFFTTCPGICPRLTANFGKVQEAFQNDS